MNITTLENAKQVPFSLDGKIMYSSPSVEIVHLKLKPGEVLPLHDNPFDVVFFVIKGEGIFFTNTEKITVKENSCFEIKTGNQRGWKNESNSDLKILVTKKFSIG